MEDRYFSGTVKGGSRTHAVKDDGVGYNSEALCGAPCDRLERGIVLSGSEWEQITCPICITDLRDMS